MGKRSKQVRKGLLFGGLKPLLSIALFFFVALNAQAQDEERKVVNDTLERTTALRVGVDLVRPIIGLNDTLRNGFEGIFDIRVYRRLFLAGSVGWESYDYVTESVPSTYSAKGMFFRLGVDYDLLDMTGDDGVFLGARYAMSPSFTRTIGTFSSNPSEVWGDSFSGGPNTLSQTAMWLEGVVSLKVQVVKNLFVGASARVNLMLHTTNDPYAYDHPVPGFGRHRREPVNIGFNYYISYQIPFKRKVVAVERKK